MKLMFVRIAPHKCANTWLDGILTGHPEAALKVKTGLRPFFYSHVQTRRFQKWL